MELETSLRKREDTWIAHYMGAVAEVEEEAYWCMVDILAVMVAEVQADDGDAYSCYSLGLPWVADMSCQRLLVDRAPIQHSSWQGDTRHCWLDTWRHRMRLKKEDMNGSLCY